MKSLRIASSSQELRGELDRWSRAGERVGLIPTMGALHAGHVSLLACAKTRVARTVVSIFVNPTQFAPDEDFAAYPRTWDADLEKLDEAGADLVFHPSAAELYPSGFSTTVTVGGPALAGLEDKFRPSHFAGVATVVAKLLILARPDVAVFGEKDYQQLAVIRRLVHDLDIPSEILAAPTFREPDGLAMSSRNAYLTEAERHVAPALNRVLNETAVRLQAGETAEGALALGERAIKKAGFALDYLELRHAATLARIAEVEGELRLLVAARLGKTRLIDNLAVTAKSES